MPQLAQAPPGRFDFGLRGDAIGPGRVVDTLAWFQLLVDGEEVVDLEPVELGHVLEFAQLLEPRVAGRDADDLVVAALLVGHPEHADRAAADQAAGKGGLLHEDQRVLDAAVYLNAPEPVLLQRLLARARSDDTAEVIRHRLAVFAETTSPLIDYYRDRGILVEVNGDQPPESTTADIQARLP